MFKIKVGRKGLIKAAKNENGFDIVAGYVERPKAKLVNMPDDLCAEIRKHELEERGLSG